jgi:uncharacterized membrane protein (DUF485 family)
MRDFYERIDRDPRFHALARRRSRLGWGLSALVLASYYAFVLGIAFAPETLARRLPGDTVLTVGIAAGLGVIVLSVALTGVYVWRANRRFDRLNAEIVADATRDPENTHAS